MDGTVDVMVNEQEEVLTLPMQPMALEVAREAMERQEDGRGTRRPRTRSKTMGES